MQNPGDAFDVVGGDFFLLREKRLRLLLRLAGGARCLVTDAIACLMGDVGYGGRRALERARRAAGRA